MKTIIYKTIRSVINFVAGSKRESSYQTKLLRNKMFGTQTMCYLELQ